MMTTDKAFDRAFRAHLSPGYTEAEITKLNAQLMRLISISRPSSAEKDRTRSAVLQALGRGAFGVDELVTMTECAPALVGQMVYSHGGGHISRLFDAMRIGNYRTADFLMALHAPCVVVRTDPVTMRRPDTDPHPADIALFCMALIICGFIVAGAIWALKAGVQHLAGLLS